jgi:integrase
MSFYLEKINRTYYFRLRVPKDLVPFFGTKQLRKSLKTKSYACAKSLVRAYLQATEKLFVAMRSDMISQEQIYQITERFKNTSLTNMTEMRRKLGLNFFLPRDFRQKVQKGNVNLTTEEKINIITNEFLIKRKYYHEQLLTNSLDEIIPQAKGLLKVNGLDDNPEKPVLDLLCEYILKSHLEICDIMIERFNGNYTNPFDSKVNTAVPLKSDIHVPSPKLSVMIGKHIEDYRRAGTVTMATLKEYAGIGKLFLEITGDKPIKEVTRDNIRAFHEALKKLPKHINKRKEYRGKTLQEILEAGDTDRISDKTIQKYMTQVEALLRWAVNEGELDRNPAEGLKYAKTSGPAHEERDAFDRKDLQMMIEGLICVDSQGNLKRRPERIWIPLIALFTGARLNEICQLHIEDVGQEPESGIWYFSITTQEDEDGNERKRVKSGAGKRLIPIHPALIELGFLIYYKRIVEGGHDRLWLNLTQSTRGWHKNFSNWFLTTTHGKGFLRKYITEDHKKVFHSFRHTFDNELKQRMVATPVLHQIMGHAGKDQSLDRYGKPYILKTCFEALNLIDYPVDFTPLKRIIKGITDIDARRRREKRLKARNTKISGKG